ncbi:MAG: cupredoxin domain-containing protein [Alphaproteobacteria bacterium]
MKKISFLLMGAILFSNSQISYASNDVLMKELVIKEHRFHPNELSLPAGKKIKLIIKNEDSTVEEFESFDLKREKIIPAGGEIKVNIGPLKAGEYKFFGEFHEATAQGIIKVVEN